MATYFSINADANDHGLKSLLSDTDTEHHDGYHAYHGATHDHVNEDAAKSCCQRRKKTIITCSAVSVGLLVLLLVLSVVLTFTVGPVIIRNTIKDSTLVISALALEQPGTVSVWVSLTGFFDRASPVPATLAGGSFSLHYEGEQVGTINLPSIPFQASWGSNAQTPVNVSAQLSITNMTSFALFSKAMIQLSSVTWSLSGASTISVPLLFGLKVKVNIDKSVVVTGLDGLRSLSLSDVSFTRSTEKHVVMDAKVHIFNPSVIAIHPIGALSLGVYYQGAFMGIAETDDTKIIQGKNVIPATAILNPSNLDLASNLISDFLSSRLLNLTVVGAGNVSSIPLYSTALKGLTVNTSFVENPPLQLIPNIDVLAMDLTPLDNQTCGLSVTMVATIFNPLGPNSPLLIGSVSVNTSLLFLGLPTGHFFTHTTILSQNATSMKVNASTIFYIDRSAIVPGSNQTAFSSLLQAIENTPFVNVGFLGSANIAAHVSALGNLTLTNLIVRVTTGVVGLNHLPGAALSTITVNGNAPGPKGSGLAIAASGTLYNPSVISMTLGDVDMDMYAENSFLGRVTCYDFAMQPGSNLLSVTGILKPANLTQAASFFNNYISARNTSVVIKGTLPSIPIPNNARFNIDWLNEAILDLYVGAVVPGRQNYQPIERLEIVDMSIDFTRPDKIPIANGTMRAWYNPPFNFPFSFINASIEADLSFAGINTAHLSLPFSPVAQWTSNQTLEMSATNLLVDVTDAEQFSILLLNLFLKDHLQAGLSGYGGTNVDTNMGIIPMRHVAFNNALPVNGADHFSEPPVTVKDLDLRGGESGVAYISLLLNITNRSSAGLWIGPMVLDLYYKGIYVGNGTIENMQFNKGLNTYPVKGLFVQTPQNMNASREFLSLFMQGQYLNVSFHGTRNSTSISYLQLAMENLDTEAVLPGFQGKLIQYAQLIFNMSSFLAFKVPAQLTVYNPFSSDILITNVYVTVMYKGNVIALIDKDLSNDPIRATNHSISVTPVMYGDIMGVSIDFFTTLWGTILVEVNGTMAVKVGTGFTAVLDYVQYNVSASFDNPPPFSASQAIDDDSSSIDSQDSRDIDLSLFQISDYRHKRAARSLRTP